MLDTGAAATTLTPRVIEKVGYTRRDGFKRAKVHTAIGAYHSGPSAFAAVRRRVLREVPRHDLWPLHSEHPHARYLGDQVAFGRIAQWLGQHGKMLFGT